MSVVGVPTGGAACTTTLSNGQGVGSCRPITMPPDRSGSVARHDRSTLKLPDYHIGGRHEVPRILVSPACVFAGS